MQKNICIFVLVKNLKFKYRTFSRVSVILMLLIFSFTTLAMDSYNCFCSSKQDAVKEKKCCSTNKKMNCCSKNENNCDNQKKNGCDNCNKCIIKKNSIETPITTNNNSKISDTKTIQIADENISLTPDNKVFVTYDDKRPPGKISKIFITLSNFRI